MSRISKDWKDIHRIIYIKAFKAQEAQKTKVLPETTIISTLKILKESKVGRPVAKINSPKLSKTTLED